MVSHRSAKLGGAKTCPNFRDASVIYRTARGNSLLTTEAFNCGE